jgi:hypothetical protein
MTDKSPRQGMTKKSDKSLKEKRADKRAKNDSAATSDVDALRKKRRADQKSWHRPPAVAGWRGDRV